MRTYKVTFACTANLYVISMMTDGKERVTAMEPTHADAHARGEFWVKFGA